MSRISPFDFNELETFVVRSSSEECFLSLRRFTACSTVCPLNEMTTLSPQFTPRRFCLLETSRLFKMT